MLIANDRFIHHYRRLGYDRFIEELEAHPWADAEEFLKHIKSVKK